VQAVDIYLDFLPRIRAVSNTIVSVFRNEVPTALNPSNELSS
jgi:hypothetical protein